MNCGVGTSALTAAARGAAARLLPHPPSQCPSFNLKQLCLLVGFLSSQWQLCWLLRTLSGTLAPKLQFHGIGPLHPSLQLSPAFGDPWQQGDTQTNACIDPPFGWTGTGPSD